MTDSPHRFRLPHWGWFLLATIILVVAFVGLSVWLPWHRERQVIQQIEGRGGHVGSETRGPQWLRHLVGEGRLKKIKVFERVLTVDWGETTITDADVGYLKRLTNLRNLSLIGRTFTDPEITHLIGLANLERLILHETSLTDAGLASLSSLRNLKEIWLTGSKVTDAGLAQLSTLTDLRLLGLHRTPVTDKGVEELRKALPRCEIKH